MRPRITLLLFFSVIILGPAAAQNPVHFPDPSLKAAVEDALWLSDPTPDDMLGLRDLSCSNSGITDITGLEYAKNLQTLNLRFNQITSISPLSGLRNLQNLSLSRNQIDGLSALSGLSGLRSLDLHGNQLSSISVLSGLANLQTLILRFNQISNISALSGLSNLQRLDLHENQISNISALSGLTNLSDLDLYDNQIGDISALSGLTNLRDLDLRYNQIGGISALGNLTDLGYLYLSGNEISSISPLAHLTRLADLYLQGNQITNISALLDLTNLQTLDLRWNPLDNDTLCSNINRIIRNNPGVLTFYDGECDTPTQSQSGVTPTVSSDPATHITESSAMLKAGVVSDGEEACEGRFRYWLPDQGETTTAWQSSLRSGMAFTREITELQPNSQYNFVAELRNSAGTDISGTGSFITVRNTFVLTVLTSPGGTVVNPGEGEFNIAQGASIPIAAQPIAKYSLFTGWTGTAVDAGAVDDPQDSNTSLLLDDDYTLKANFLENIVLVFSEVSLVSFSAKVSNTSGSK